MVLCSLLISQETRNHHYSWATKFSRSCLILKDYISQNLGILVLAIVNFGHFCLSLGEKRWSGSHWKFFSVFILRVEIEEDYFKLCLYFGVIWKWMYILEMSVSLSLHIIYCIFLNVLKVLFLNFICTLPMFRSVINWKYYKSNSYSSNHLVCIVTILVC